MEPKRRRILIAVLLMLSIVNYTRIVGTENIRAVEFLSILAIGMLSGLLLREVISSFRSK